ncbi:hypothetical protein IMCC9480_3622 [Oxalobacteraceae bacterium IMCC9480]|nr:hypothetical protein IMCC9480_3622 [Oxalobacteraceae bacterium IMCC9480]NDP60540.1 hypothetical protein [Oxalobacteraceae bacterium]
MPSQPSQAESGHYIIRSTDPAALANFIHEASVDPELTLIDKIGPAGQPHTVVVAMSNAKATALGQRFTQASPLKIEPDRPLSLFGHSGRRPGDPL